MSRFRKSVMFFAIFLSLLLTTTITEAKTKRLILSGRLRLSEYEDSFGNDAEDAVNYGLSKGFVMDRFNLTINGRRVTLKEKGGAKGKCKMLSDWRIYCQSKSRSTFIGENGSSSTCRVNVLRDFTAYSYTKARSERTDIWECENGFASTEVFKGKLTIRGQ